MENLLMLAQQFQKVSADNSQKGQTQVITDPIRASWKVSLMSALNRSVLTNAYSKGLGFDYFYMLSSCRRLHRNILHD
jgi:hypothetical protein